MKTYYYSDELNDDFAENGIKTKRLPHDYKYFTTSPLRRAFAFVLYHFIAFPVVYVIQKIAYREKIIGRNKLKPYKKEGFFLYGNHTRSMGDAYAPSIVSFPKKAYIVVSPDAVSITGIKRIVEDLGAIPVPDDPAGIMDYYNAVKKHAGLGHIVAVYPEAHIWPFYTKIRPFADTSFKFPKVTGKPAFTFTATYKKRRFGKGVKTTVYIDGPFFPDPELDARTDTARLRDLCYGAMTARSAESTYSKNRYIKAEKQNESRAAPQ